MNEKTNSEKINSAFRELSGLIPYQFETVSPIDLLSVGTDKIVANLRLVKDHLERTHNSKTKESTIG